MPHRVQVTQARDTGAIEARPAAPLAPAGPATLLPASMLSRPARWHAALLSPFGLVALDAAAVLAAYFVAYFLRFHVRIPPPAEFHPLRGYVSTMVLGSAATLAAFAALGLYSRRNLVSLVEQSFRAAGGAVAGLIATLALSVLALRGYSEFSRLLLLYEVLACIALVTAGRLAWMLWRDQLARQGVAVRHVVIVGAGQSGQRVAAHFAAVPTLGYRVVGFLDDTMARGSFVPTGQRVLGTTRELATLLSVLHPDELVVAAPGLSNERMLQLIVQCEQHRTGVRVFPDLFQIRVSDASVVNLQGLQLIEVKAAELQQWQRVIKRWFDVVFSAAALVFLSPFILLVAVLVKLDSPGPALYAQERVGQDGKRFHVVKFRSMIDQAEELTGRFWTVPGDDRRTRIGGWLRRLSIDEFPQFINVLVGDMSVVGPRPERPIFVAEFSGSVPDYLKRLREKSGITGWAQVNGLRGDVSIEERTKYDLHYVENWSLWLDIKIVCRSFLRIFRDESAY